MLKVKDGVGGNASTATALQTSRTINGTSFNGSTNITTANWGTARTLTIGNTGKSVNGSANVSWSIAEIGASRANTSLSGYEGLTLNDGSTSNWIRTTSNGIIPYQSGGASALGTASWPFNSIYGQAIYEGGTALSSKYAAKSHSHSYLPLGGGTLTGQLVTTYAPPVNSAMVRLHTSGDGNAIGDGNTHIAYNGGNGYSHYFRGTGVTYINTTGGCAVSENLVVSKNSYFGYSVYVGGEGETDYRAVSIRRVANGVQYEGRFCASYANNVKLSTSSTATVKYGAAMDCQQGGSTKNRVLLTQDCMIPSSDNVSYCGASSHRWQALYASTGTVYSSSKNEKENIQSVSIQPLDNDSKSVKEIIKDGIKNTNIYSYSYKTLENDNTFIGFLGQELEEQSPEFFKLIGDSYEREDGIKQYDIRESSVIGVLWSALQDALNEIDILKNKK